jgi:acyl carrier protein
LSTGANETKLREIFSQSLGLDLIKINDALQYQEVGEWDSISHMALVAAIDDGFGVMLETEDILDLSSFGKAKVILGKYGVSF